MKNSHKSKGGVSTPKNHRYTFRLDEEQNARFLSMLEKSGTRNKSKFILCRIFG